MKVSFLIRNLGVRGSVRRIVELSNHLIRRGHEAIIYHSDGAKCEWLTCLADTETEAQFDHDTHDRIIFFGDADHWRMVKRTWATVKALYILGLNEKDNNLKSVLTWDYKTDSRTQAVREAIHAPDVRVLVNCSALANFMHSIDTETWTVYGGVNSDVFYPRPIRRDPLLILAGGAKREIEGTGLVLQTMELVKETMPDVRLELYAKMGYSQDYLAELYSRSAVFLDAQHHGGWNNAVAEAMACGTPVVCTDIWGNKDFAVNKQTAMLANEPAKMAWAILRLLREPDLVKMLTTNASLKILPFTWERATDQLLEALA